MHGHRGPTVALVLALASLTGCLVTGTLDPTGGARLTLKLRLVSAAHFEPIKAGLQSPYVTLKSASMTPKKVATFEVECSDVRKLSTAPSLSPTRVALADGDAATQTMAVTLSNPVPEQWSDAVQAYFGRELRVSIDLPGEVVRSNATSSAGRTVSWTWSLAELPARPSVDLTATFKLPPGARDRRSSADVPELHRYPAVKG